MVSAARQYLPCALGKNFRLAAGNAGQGYRRMVSAACKILPTRLGIDG